MDDEELLRARVTLRRHFGHQDFRPLQLPAVRAMLAGRDVLAVLPTGAGKSACFQIPALLQEGLTVVVSPLISLMHDQVQAATQRGLSAAALTSVTPSGERRCTVADVREGRLRLLYVSPERLASGRLEELLGGAPVRRVAVDEAHCVAEWGHDFRPAYRRIAAFCAAVGAPPVGAFTATATPATRREIEEVLGLRSPVRVVGPVDRPNLWWGVSRARTIAEGVARVAAVARRAGGTGIAYVATRERAVRLAEALLRLGLKAAPYHAGLSPAVRDRVQQAFLAGELRAVCATTAFGMGIDHPGVRFVCHLGSPASLEGYVQEAGRAGRNGGPARCLLIRLPGDLRLQRGLLEASRPSPRLLASVWAAMPVGRPVTAAWIRERLGTGLRAGEERIAAALRLLVGFECARPAPGREESVVRGPEALRRRIDFGAPVRARRRAAARLAAVRGYARTLRCRRAVIAEYFGQDPPACDGCDRCDARPR